jgi:hypothetical protein
MLQHDYEKYIRYILWKESHLSALNSFKNALRDKIVNDVQQVGGFQLILVHIYELRTCTTTK